MRLRKCHLSRSGLVLFSVAALVVAPTALAQGKDDLSKAFSWGVAAEYAYGGTLDVNQQGSLPVALGGRGDLVGSFNDAATWFLAANFNWKH
jgi:hypothetical protein